MHVTRTFDILDQLAEKYPDKEDILAARVNGSWKKTSVSDYVEQAYAFAAALLEMGFKKGDRIASVSNNRPEWNIMDMGMAMAGVVHVPVYPTISKSEYEYILGHAEPGMILLSDAQLFNKIAPVAEKVKSIDSIYTFNEVNGATHWSVLMDTGKRSLEQRRDELETIKQGIGPDELVTIIYTSGTTGMPKGVMLSHRNLVTNAIATSKHQRFDHRHRTLSFLPISHVYERMMNYHFQYKGMSTYYAENVGTIARDAQEVQPSLFNAVPRLLENVYDKIIGKGKDLPYIPKVVFFWAVRLGHKYNPETRNNAFFRMKLKIADRLIFSKWRASLGGCTTIVTGGAAIQPRLMRVFWAAGIELYEGYGLTETSPVIAVSNQVTREFKLGCAGLILDGVEVKIADDGEILARGPNVMLGYYKQPEFTDEVIDKDGFFHTGDIGTIVDGRYLKITDRKKEIFKLSSGKYIAPQAIENKFKESFFIEQVMVIGENQKFASALISPNFHFLHNWASRHGFKFRDNKQLIRDKRVIDRYQREVNELNEQLGQVERIKRFRLVEEEWSPQTGEMSPTLKLKRRVLEDKYRDVIRGIFFENGA